MGKWRLRSAEGVEGSDIVSLIGEGTVFTGDLVLKGGARIDGKVVGRITAHALLVVGPSGDIDAQELHASHVSRGDEYPAKSSWKSRASSSLREASSRASSSTPVKASRTKRPHARSRWKPASEFLTRSDPCANVSRLQLTLRNDRG